MKLLSRLFLFAAVFAASVQMFHAQTRAQEDKREKAAPLTSAQSNQQEIGENEVLSVTTTLVRVPVSVRDRDGRYIADLKKEDFRIYENGVEQQAAHFGGVEEPLSIVLLIDVSCSIEKPEETKAAALTFIDQLRPADSVLPVAFGRNIYALLTESTRDHALLRERILNLPDGKQIPCDNGTRLYDAVDFVIHRILKKGTGRKAVILLTDGNDSNLSRPGSFVKTLQDVSELGIPFYSIRLVSKWKGGDRRFRGFPNDNPAERAKHDFFWRDLDNYIVELARLSGGRSYPAAQGEELKSNFRQIGEELRHQYMLAYYPSTPGDTLQRRKIKVQVSRPKISVRARDSYIYIPSGK